jgi:hypothetical protein
LLLEEFDLEFLDEEVKAGVVPAQEFLVVAAALVWRALFAQEFGELAEDAFFSAVRLG